MLWHPSYSWVSCSRDAVTAPAVLGMASCSSRGETWERLRKPADVHRAMEEPVSAWGGKVWGTPPTIPSGGGMWGWAIVLGTCLQRLSEDLGQETVSFSPFSQMAKWNFTGQWNNLAKVTQGGSGRAGNKTQVSWITKPHCFPLGLWMYYNSARSRCGF